MSRRAATPQYLRIRLGARPRRFRSNGRLARKGKDTMANMKRWEADYRLYLAPPPPPDWRIQSEASEDLERQPRPFVQSDARLG